MVMLYAIDKRSRRSMPFDRRRVRFGSFSLLKR